MLTTGLIIGSAMGAAVASADSGDSSAGAATSSSPGPGTTSSTSSPSSSAGTAGHNAANPSLDKAIRDAIRAVTDGLTAGLRPHHGKSAQNAADDAAEAADPVADGAADAATIATGESDTTTPATDTGTAVAPVVAVTAAVAPITGTTTPATESVAQPATEPSSGGSSTAPAAATSTSTPDAATPEPAATPAPTLTSLLDPATVALSSATNFVVAVGNAVISLPALLAALPTSSTPVADVITYLQATLTSVGGSLIPLAALPGEVANAVLSLSANLPDAVATPRSTGPATGYLPGVGLDVPRAPAMPTPAAGDPSPRNPVILATRGGFAAPPAATEPAHPVAAPAAPAPESHNNTPLLITGALAALLLSASLWALFAAALPGLGGLAAFSATGMRIGYRQAKAGTALYQTDLARFAPRGPIGVVRSDTRVSVHRRQVSTGEQPAKRHLRLVDTAA